MIKIIVKISDLRSLVNNSTLLIQRSHNFLIFLVNHHHAHQKSYTMLLTGSSELHQYRYRLLSSPFQVEEEDEEKNKQFYDVCKNVNEKKQ